MAIFIVLLIIVLYVLYIIKLNDDLLKTKDNILRGLAGVDAALIKKSAFMISFLASLKELMPKEEYLIKELYATRSEMTKTKPRIDNAEYRFSLQRKFDQKLEYLLGAMNKYPEIKSNFAIQDDLKELAKQETLIEEKTKFYNATIDKMNWLATNFPASVLVKLSNVKSIPPRYEK